MSAAESNNNNNNNNPTFIVTPSPAVSGKKFPNRTNLSTDNRVAMRRMSNTSSDDDDDDDGEVFEVKLVQTQNLKTPSNALKNKTNNANVNNTTQTSYGRRSTVQCSADTLVPEDHKNGDDEEEDDQDEETAVRTPLLPAAGDRNEDLLGTPGHTAPNLRLARNQPQMLLVDVHHDNQDHHLLRRQSEPGYTLQVGS